MSGVSVGFGAVLGTHSPSSGLPMSLGSALLGGSPLPPVCCGWVPPGWVTPGGAQQGPHPVPHCVTSRLTPRRRQPLSPDQGCPLPWGHTHTHTHSPMHFVRARRVPVFPTPPSHPPTVSCSRGPQGAGAGHEPPFPSPLLVYGPGHRAAGPARGAAATDNKTSLVSSGGPGSSPGPCVGITEVLGEGTLQPPLRTRSCAGNEGHLQNPSVPAMGAPSQAPRPCPNTKWVLTPRLY